MCLGLAMSAGGLLAFCQQLCDIVPAPASDVSNGNEYRRLAATGVMLHSLSLALDKFASEHCEPNAGIFAGAASEGGLSYNCELRAPVMVPPPLSSSCHFRRPQHSQDIEPPPVACDR
jgi:hypothetical protein